MPLNDRGVAELVGELNSSLAVVSGHVASARSRLKAEPPDVASAERELDAIARVCARSAELMHRLLAEMRERPH